MTIATGEKMYAADILNLTFFPVGAILIFSSAAWNAASAGFKNIWKVCNAANHAANPIIPDLTNRFLRGADSSGATGGADSQSVTLTADNLPTHHHDATGLSISDLTLVPPALSPLSISGLSLANMAISGLSANEGGSHEHTLSGGVTSAGSHSHGVTDTGHAHNVSANAGSDSGGGAIVDGNYGGGSSVVASGTSTTGISIGWDGSHEHGFSSTSNAVAVAGHTHSVTGGVITGSITGGTISGGSLTGGSITGGKTSGSTADVGTSQAFSVDTVPAYYTVIYIMKAA
jgi:hypothetical protein